MTRYAPDPAIPPEKKLKRSSIIKKNDKKKKLHPYVCMYSVYTCVQAQPFVFPPLVRSSRLCELEQWQFSSCPVFSITISNVRNFITTTCPADHGQCRGIYHDNQAKYTKHNICPFAETCFGYTSIM